MCNSVICAMCIVNSSQVILASTAPGGSIEGNGTKPVGHTRTTWVKIWRRCTRTVGIKEEVELKSRYAGNLSVRTSNITEYDSLREVVVTDIKMPFGSMVVFMIKWSLASIPAVIILLIIYAIAVALFGFGGIAAGLW